MNETSTTERKVLKDHSLIHGQNFAIMIAKKNRQAEADEYQVDASCSLLVRPFN